MPFQALLGPNEVEGPTADPFLHIYISGASLHESRYTLVALYDYSRYNGTRQYRSAHSQCVVVGEIHEPALFCYFFGGLFSCARHRWANE